MSSLSSPRDDLDRITDRLVEAEVEPRRPLREDEARRLGLGLAAVAAGALLAIANALNELAAKTR